MVEIDMCYSTNSSREHDCAFTSAPADVTWWCKHPKGPEIIKDSYVIDKKCPFLE